MDDKLFNKIITALILILFTCLGSVLFLGRGGRTFSFAGERKLPIYSVEKQGNEVALTFDINWAETDYIYEILDILKEKKVKATFFIMGGWVETSEENVEKLKRIYAEGHEVGNHSYMHPDMTKVSRDKIIKEIEMTDAVIRKYLGIETNLFRFPSGAYNDLSMKVIEEVGKYSIQWDSDSVDWKEQGAEIEYLRIMNKVKPGSIMLFHNDARYTPGNLIRIIDDLNNKGYQFVIISQLIYKENYYIDNDGRQFIK
ncbi:polysaccharide deacetylase family protein [Alloiococcus sp. CFN-8]|uniref:polysaccharide deacetylase family protein n=1 Tax=Alloiococcus sp. CFN-8 TaxID=3416081 RepID=UPI003CF244CD